jgi:hypothetical protein
MLANAMKSKIYPFFNKLGRFSGLTKDGLMILVSYNHQKTAFYCTNNFCLERTSHGSDVCKSYKLVKNGLFICFKEKLDLFL